MEREVGGGIRMGNTCKPMAESCQWMTKCTTMKKKKRLVNKFLLQNLTNNVEKKIATHSSILAWRIPWMEEPGGLQSTGSQRVGHD